MGGENNDREEEMNMLGDLTWDRHNPRPILENQPRQPLIYEKSVGEDNLIGVIRLGRLW
jgi:hypothetical protein